MSLLRPPTNNNNNNNNARKKQKVKNTSDDNDNDTDDTDDTSFLDLHDHIRVTILNYLGETQDELITLTLVSKQVYEDCKQPGIKWKIIPTIQIRPRQQQQGGSTLALVQQLRNHHVSDNENIRRYHHMKVNDVHKFDSTHSNVDIYNFTRKIQMDWILSLDISVSMPVDVSMPMDVQRMPILIALSQILPNLREINLSNIRTDLDGLQHFSINCPQFEKLTWNNITIITGHFFKFSLDGSNMMQAKNLKEIIMDDSDFNYQEWKDEEMSIVDDTSRGSRFLFCYCSKALERVSIRNMKWNSEVVSQDVLIKFVRNVPTLRWFRSDLTIENMNMLHLERPEIVLLN